MFWQTWPAVDLKKVLSVTKHGFVLRAQRHGAPNGKFWEKTWKQQQRFTKAFWYHVKQFGILLVKIHLFLTPSKTDGRVPSQQGAPTTCNQTSWEVSQQTFVETLLDILWPVWVWSQKIQLFSEGRWDSKSNWCGQRAKFNPLSWGWRVSDTKSRQTPWNVYFPPTLSIQGHINFPKSPSKQNITWRTDILRNRSIGCPSMQRKPKAKLEIYKVFKDRLTFLNQHMRV